MRKKIKRAYKELYNQDENFASFQVFKQKIAKIKAKYFKNYVPSLKDIVFQHGYFCGWSIDKGIKLLKEWFNEDKVRKFEIPAFDVKNGNIHINH